MEQRDFVAGASGVSEASFDQRSQASQQITFDKMRVSREGFSVKSSDNLMKSQTEEYNKRLKQQKLMAKLRKKKSK